MQLFEECGLYQTLWNLVQSKADVQRLIAFVGQDIANKFLAIRSKLKSPENDLYYWIKNKTPEELKDFVAEVESVKSKAQLKKDIATEGAQLICDTPHWKVYHILTYEAAQAYGRDTHWCITGINAWGDAYYKSYKNEGADFYFLITKGHYDPRGYDSKYAIAIYPDKVSYEAFDQKDGQVLLQDIQYIEQIEIPGLDLWAMQSRGERCSMCGDLVPAYVGHHDGECYCDACWDSLNAQK